MGVLAISSRLIDPANAFSDVCRPLAEIPAWWSGFLFQVLNPRQLSLYVYLCMLAGESGVCHPTAMQIRHDLGLSSGSIVFDAISALERNGFILRERRRIEELNSRRNVYQRPSCQFTMLRLLQLGKIDGEMRPAPGFLNELSNDGKRLRDEWLRNALGAQYFRYETADAAAKAETLISILQTLVRPTL